MMKLRVSNEHYKEHEIAFGAEYLPYKVIRRFDVCNTCNDNRRTTDNPTKISLRISLDDFKDEPFKSLFITESIDDIINRLQEYAKPIVDGDNVSPRWIKTVIEYSPDRKGPWGELEHMHLCCIKSFTSTKIDDNTADLDFEFILM